MQHYLTHDQQQSLRNAARPAIRPGVYKPNPELDLMIALIKAETPEGFQTADSLARRRFFDEPSRNVPHAGFERAAPKDFKFGVLPVVGK